MPVYKRKFFIQEFVNEKMGEQTRNDVNKQQEALKFAGERTNQILSQRTGN